LQSRTHLLLADLDHINSLFATSRKNWRLRISLIPRIRRFAGSGFTHLLCRRDCRDRAYLAAPRGDDEEDLFRWRLYLANLKKMAAEPHKACHLVSPRRLQRFHLRCSCVIRGILRIRLEAKLNGRSARLEIDTGADGLVVSHSAAEHAHLKSFSQTQMTGVGDQADKLGYTAYADSIRIGNLEFQDCTVRVLDSKSGLDEVDGLIGMDVFSHFLVTLDYPMRKLLLGHCRRAGRSGRCSALAENERRGPDDTVAPAQRKMPRFKKRALMVSMTAMSHRR